MKIITDLKEANMLLQSYSGATLQIEVYSTSLRRMALKLFLSGIEEVLYVVGIGCESLHGSFYIKNVTLQILEELNNENDETITIIADKLVSFSLITSGGFSMAQGLESDFGKSFDDFLKNKN